MKASLDEIVKINKQGQSGGSGQPSQNQQKTDTIGDTEPNEPGEPGEPTDSEAGDSQDSQDGGQSGKSKGSEDGPMVKSGDFSDDDAQPSVTVVRGPMTGEVMTKEQGRRIADAHWIPASPQG